MILKVGVFIELNEERKTQPFTFLKVKKSFSGSQGNKVTIWNHANSGGEKHVNLIICVIASNSKYMNPLIIMKI